MEARDQKTALVTGGNRGIGLATVKGLADLGLDVLLGCRDRVAGEAAAAGIGGAVTVVELDLSDRQGMSDQLDAIFQEFHQCKSPGASKEGFGLGLAIVKRLADLLEHPLEVASEPGNGSRFSVWLPAADDQSVSTASDDQQASPAGWESIQELR